MSKKIKIIIMVMAIIIVGLVSFIVVDKVVLNKDKNDEKSKNEIANVEESNVTTNKNEVVNKTTGDIGEYNNTETKGIASLSDKDFAIGGVSLGEGGQGMEYTFGSDYTSSTTKEEASGNDITTCVYKNLGITVDIVSSTNNADGSVCNIVSIGKCKTPRNLSVGSTKKEVLAAYKSENILVSEDRDENNIYVGYPGATIYDKQIVYKIENDKVVSIIIATALAE